jgi:hypothetical protein
VIIILDTRKDDTFVNTKGIRLEAGETRMSMEEITEMFMSIDNDFQLMLGRSDMFCQVVRFVTLTVNIKYVEPAGSGFVLLIRPDSSESKHLKQEVFPFPPLYQIS